MKWAAFVCMLFLCGCVARQADDGAGGSYDDREVEYMLRANEPISNLRDEGFVPLPGYRNVYFIPGTDFVVKCGDRFDLNASMKKTFHCYYVDRRMRKISGSDFDVQINPWRGDQDGFSPYR